MEKEIPLQNTENEEKPISLPRARRTMPSFSEMKDSVTEEPVAEETASKRNAAEEKTEETVEISEADHSEEEDSKTDTPQEALENQESLPQKEETKSKEVEEYSASANTFDWIKSFLFSLTAVIFIFTLIFRGVTVNGGSMLPTLQDKEYLIISDLLYTPKTGDIVVVQSPNYKNGTEPLIKRVIATGGQTVRINFNTWQVWVNDVELKEDYIFFENNTIMNYEDMIPDKNGEASVVVEENCIFVMGDHRNDSLDSRSESVGQIDERYIMGRVLIRVTPFNRFGKVK